MNKINKLIEKYNSNYITFDFLSDLIEVSDILLTETETKELIKFYDKELENLFSKG